MSEKELKEIEEKIKSELEPFLDGIRTEKADCELFKKAYDAFGPKYWKAWQIFDFITQDWDKISKFEAIEQIHLLFSYLGLVESLGNSIVDMIVMLLVANGRDFHIECRYATPRIKHVVAIKDLERERVPLTTKLNFLRENDINNLASVIDSELRNAIAHLKFDVKERKIYIKRKPAEKVLYSSIKKLMRALRTADNSLMNLAHEKGLYRKEK